jgi:glutaconate CoA-transferase subunit B
MELQLTALYPGVTADAARAATGWPLRVADRLTELPPPTAEELEALRALQARTRAAHG